MKNCLDPSWLAMHGREFTAGLIRPSLAALCGALVVAAALVLLGITFVTPKRLAGRLGDYILTSPSDEYAWLTVKALRIHGSNDPTPAVAVIGDSTTREAISGRSELEEALGRELGRPAHAYVLSGGGLRAWEAAALTDQLPGHFHGLVVLEISPEALCLDQQFLGGLSHHPRLALDSAAFADELRIAGVRPRRRLGNYFLDHFEFFLARPRILVNLATHSIALHPHMVDHWREPTPQEWDRVISNMANWQADYAANHGANLAVYDRMIQRLRAGGISVALLEEVRNPRAEAQGYASAQARRMLEEYRTDVKRFADERGIAWWDLSKSASLLPDDFLDHTHLRSPAARQRFTRELAGRAAGVLAQSSVHAEASR